MAGQMGGELQFIVDRLNDPPFQMQLTMVAFDEKSPFELLEVVNEVMANLSSQHRIDLRDETPDATATRMLEFMRVLNYKISIEMQQAKAALLHGEPQLIYPMLAWMLQRLPELQKRAYLARFLVNVEVPEHMFTDEEVVEVYQNYKDLQEEFKEVHKTSDKYKSQLISPNEIKKAIMQMEEDKGMLEQKVENLKTKLADHERFEEMFEATHKLRLQQDEQVKLQDRLKDQKAQLLQAEARLNGMVERLNAQRSERSSSSQDARQTLEALEREVDSLEQRALETLPKEIQLKQRRMEELQQVLAEPSVNEVEVAQMEQQQKQMARAVQQLEERKRAQNINPDDKLAMFRQQATLVAKKREAIAQRLATVGRERAGIEAELAEKAGDLAKVSDRPVLKGDEFRKYASELRGKTAVYKRYRAELSEIRAEWGVVSRTEGLLRQQERALAATLGEVEARRGLTGYGHTQEELEKVSAAKAEVDEVKGKTLEELSAVVAEINDKIKRHKNKLAPQIVKLRKMRTDVRDKETGYLEKKTLYNNTKAGIDSDLGTVRAEAEVALKEAAHEESNVYYYESLGQIETVKLQRSNDERAGRFRRTLPDGTQVRSYKELYAHKIKQQDAASKELRDRQKRIKENQGPNAKQVKMFKDLHKLLRCKVDMQQRARAEAVAAANMEQEETNVFTMPDDNGEVMGF
jgi:intraflagellar transport protein 81